MKKKWMLLVLFAAAVTATLPMGGRLQAQDSPARRIQVTAKRFGYQPDNITLKKGEPVILVLTSADVAHGLRFRELNLNAKIDKGRSSELSFTPTRTGDFVGHCSVFCGTGHGRMTLTLHVVE